jgi:hypothetical protein
VWEEADADSRNVVVGTRNKIINWDLIKDKTQDILAIDSHVVRQDPHNPN